MMTHIEGPIVDSFYDMALCSWSKRLEPPLPSYDSPAASTWYTNIQQPNYDEHARESEALLNDERTSHRANGSFGGNFENGNNTDLTSKSIEHSDPLPEHSAKDPHYDTDIKAELTRARSVLEPRGSESRVNIVTRHLSKLVCFSVCAALN